MDLLNVLWRARMWIVVLLVAGALLGAGLSFLMPKRWTATALVQIGQVGDISKIIEVPARAIERVRDLPFVESVLRDLSLPTEDSTRDPRAQMLRSSLRIDLRRGSDLLEVQVEALSREDSRRFATAVVARLSAVHALIAEPGIQRLRRQLELTEREIADAVTVRTKLFDSAIGLRDEIASGNRSSESLLLGSLVTDQDAETRRLREMKVNLEEQLSPRRTFPTAPLSEVYVPTRPSSPRIASFVLAGAFVGGLLGLIVGVRRRTA